MRIIPNFTINNIAYGYNNGIGAKKAPHTQNFCSNEIQNVTPDYMVNKPIAYTKLDDIQLPNNLKAHCYKLANGQKVVIVPKKGATVVKTYVNTGSLNEPDNVRGISHYIEHNLFNGSEALGDKDFFKEINKIGVYSNASTSFSETNYIISSSLQEQGDLEKEIKLQAGMLQTPKFLEEKLAKEKKIVDSEINMYLSDDTTKAVTTTIKNLFNVKSKAPDLVAGSTDNIDALTRQDVVNYFNNNYYPANMVTVITGDAPEQETIQLVAKYFNSNKQPSQNRHFEEMTPTDHPIREDVISKKKTGAAEVFLGFAGPGNANEKDKVYLRAVNQLIFGLSDSKIKDICQKYSADISPSIERLGTKPDDKTAIIIQGTVPEENTEAMLKDFYAMLEKLAKNPPSEDEFNAVKTQIKKINSIDLESSEALNFHIGEDFLNGIPNATSDYNKIIDSMTYDDFINTVKKYYDLNKTAITVVHPKTSSAQSIKNNYAAAQKQISFTGNTEAKAPIDLNKITQYKMPNNYEIAFIDADTDVIDYSADIFTKDNSAQKAAVDDVLYDMLQYCGTKDHSVNEISKMSDRNGVSDFIISGINNISISGDFPVDNAQAGLNIFAEKLQHPEFTQELFDQAVKHCKDFYAGCEPDAIQKYNKAMYTGTQREYTRQEKAQNIDNITLDDVKNLYNEILAKSQGQIVVTGPFNKHPELKQMVFKQAESFAKAQPKDISEIKCFKPNDNTKVYTTETNRNQAEIIEGYKFKKSGNLKDDTCIDLMNEILGGGQSSRLFNDLRERRHLCYTVVSNYKTYGDIGILELKTKTTTNNTESGEKSLDNIKKSLDGFNDNINKITTEKVNDEELKHAKRVLKEQILSSLEMNGGKTEAISDTAKSPYGVTYINKQFDLIDSITPDDILYTAQNIFKNKPIISVAATKESLDANQEYLNGIK